jgi:hypothetical protein
MNLINFAAMADGGLVTNDRGNGAGGPGYIKEAYIYAALNDEPNDWTDWGQRVTEVSETEDADAWRLAREAFAAHGFVGEPEAVAVSVCTHREASEPNPYTLIVAR